MDMYVDEWYSSEESDSDENDDRNKTMDHNDSIAKVEGASSSLSGSSLPITSMNYCDSSFDSSDITEPVEPGHSAEAQLIVSGSSQQYSYITRPSKRKAIDRNGFLLYSVMEKGSRKVHDTSFLICSTCQKVMKSERGDHLSRHKERCSISQTRREKEQEKEKSPSEMIAKAVLDGRMSLRTVDQPWFREMLCGFANMQVEGFSDEQLPKRDLVKRRILDIGEQRMKKCVHEMGTYAKTGQLTLSIDHGEKMGRSFLSVKGFYATVEGPTDNRRYEQRSKALGFLDVTDKGKDAKSTAQALIEVFEKHGWTSDDFRRCFIVSDGASSMKTLGSCYASGYSRCFAHVYNKIAEHVTAPYKDAAFTADERMKLMNIEKLYAAADRLAKKFRRRQKKHPSLVTERLPVLSCPTKWLTKMQCLRDIVALLSYLDGIEDMEDDVKLLDQYRTEMQAICEVLTTVEPFLNKHKGHQHVINVIFNDIHGLYSGFVKLENSSDQSRNLIGRSAISSLKGNLMRTVNELHFATARLNPRSCKMGNIAKMFDDVDVIAVADQCIEDIWKILHPHYEIGTKSLVKRSKQDEDDFGPADDSFEAEPNEPEDIIKKELALFLQNPTTMTITEFWAQHAMQFPCLSRVASKLISIPTNSVSNERDFSMANHLVNKDRNRLLSSFSEILLVSSQLPDD